MKCFNLRALLAITVLIFGVLGAGCPSGSPTPIPSPQTGLKKWKLELVDDFKGPGSASGAAYPYSGQDVHCYGQSLICFEPISGKLTSCSNSGSKLTSLNKCLWAVGRGVNYMPSADDRHNRFDVDQVEVNAGLDNGVLILRGNLTGESGNNCKTDVPIDQLSCRYKSGYIDSSELSSIGAPHGYHQAGGLIQIRSKLSIGTGSWPGLWMCGIGSWPQHGEIDLLETDALAVKSWQTLHTSACYVPQDTAKPFQYLDWAECGQKGGTQWHLGKGNYVESTDTRLDTPSKTLADAYHTYTVAWSPGLQMKFATDNVFSHTVNTGDLHSATSMQNSSAPSMNIPVQVPTAEKAMVLILNQSIAWADYSKFKPQTLYVDYVKLWSPCGESESANPACTYCVSGGKEANGYCKVASLSLLDSSIEYWVDADPKWPGVYYKKPVSGCAQGSTPAGPNCLIHSFSQGEVETNIRYWVDTRAARQGVYYLPMAY